MYALDAQARQPLGRSRYLQAVPGHAGHAMTDALLREPDFDFQDYRAWCELVDAKLLWAELDFVKWLYSDANSRL